jgi:Domain of unknown function (DUF4159)
MRIRTPFRRRLVLALLAGLACAAATAYAQQGSIWVNPGGFGGFRRYPPRWATERDFDGSFLYCRGYYESVRSEAGGMGWWTDYPDADHNFLVRLAELTRIRVQWDKRHDPTFVVINLADPVLFRCPMLFMEDVGTADFTDKEAQNLKEYFLKGGFLWVDDFWGSAAWEHWRRTIARILPPAEFPIVDIPASHPIMRSLYDVKDVPQIPSINCWMRECGGDTSERGYDSAVVHFRAIQDSRGRLMVLMSHNTDIADSWEREGESQEYFDRFSPRGYAVGVNAVIYAMTH